MIVLSTRIWATTILGAVMLGGCASNEPSDSRFNSLLGRLDLRGDASAGGAGWGGSLPGTRSSVTQRGTGDFLSQGLPPVRAQPTLSGDDGYQLNLIDAPIPAAARYVLGESLGLNYAVDPDLPGTITLQTSSPVSREALIDIFETTLAANGYAIVQNSGVYRIVQSGTAITSTPPVSVPSATPGAPGVRIVAVPLSFIAAEEMRDILTPISPPGAILRFDPVRNYLLVAGTSVELDAMLDAVSVFDVDWMRGKSVALHPLNDASPQAVASQLEEIFRSDEGAGSEVIRFLPNDQLRSILVVTSQPSYLSRAATWIHKLDSIGGAGQERLFVYPVQNRAAEDLAGVLQSAMGQGGSGVAPGLGAVEVTTGDEGEEVPGLVGLGSEADLVSNVSSSVVADSENNALLINATPEEYRRLEPVLRRLDTMATQVMLEAIIVEVTLTDELQFGVRWFLQNGNGNARLSDLAGGGVGPNFPGFSWNTSAEDFQFALNALSSVTDVRVISSPTLMALNNQEAVLQVGDQVPIITRTSESVEDANAPVVSSVELRDTGIILNVVPRVNSAGGVLLDIEQEASRVTRTTTSGIDSPTIQQRRLRTRVSLSDGEALVLGGLIQEGTERRTDGIPVLSKVPVLGGLFRNRSDRLDRTELLIFVRPHVVRDARAARLASDEFRRGLDLGGETARQRAARDLQRLR